MRQVKPYWRDALHGGFGCHEDPRERERCRRYDDVDLEYGRRNFTLSNERIVSNTGNRNGSQDAWQQDYRGPDEKRIRRPVDVHQNAWHDDGWRKLPDSRREEWNNARYVKGSFVRNPTASAGRNTEPHNVRRMQCEDRKYKWYSSEYASQSQVSGKRKFSHSVQESWKAITRPDIDNWNVSGSGADQSGRKDHGIGSRGRRGVFRTIETEANAERNVEHLIIKAQEDISSKKKITLEEHDWDFESEQEELRSREFFIWFENFLEDEENLLGTTVKFDNWMKVGKVKMTIDDETTFCDPSILREILRCKSEFDSISSNEIWDAHKRSTPFELYKSDIFSNRASMKMAHLDYAFNYMLTDPKFGNIESSLVEGDEGFAFAEVCAGYGGLSEYVLWKNQGSCLGYSLDRRKVLESQNHKSSFSEPMHPIGNGNIFDDGNQVEFRDFVMRETKGRGVHLAVADGGVSVIGQENIQEILSQRLYLCQFLVALMVLREGGNFVCKLFDLFTPFSVGVVYLMSFCFERIAIFKPVFSRSANSERYIVCHGMKKNCGTIVEYFRKINLMMSEVCPEKKESNLMVLEVVPVDVLISDEEFFNWIKESNDLLGSLQILSLMKIKTFVYNKSLCDPYRADYEKSCLDNLRIGEDNVNYYAF